MVFIVVVFSRCKFMIIIGIRIEGWGGGGYCLECCW